MGEFIARNGWAVTVPAAVLIAVAGWLISLKIRKHKRLGWSYKATAVLDPEGNIPSDVQITYKGIPVVSVWLVSVTVKNLGTEEILEGDYHSPLKITIGPGAVLSASLDEPQDDSIQASSELVDGGILIRIPLLNPREHLKLTILTDKRPNVDIKTRIRGLTKIERLREFDSYSSILFRVAVAMFASTVLGGTVDRFIERYDEQG